MIDVDGRVLKSCYIKDNNEKVQVLIIKDQLMLIMAVPLKDNLSKAKIVYLDQLKYVELAVDRSNPRALMVASNFKKEDLLLFFDNFVVLIEAKGMIEKAKALSKHNFRAFLKDVLMKYEADVVF